VAKRGARSPISIRCHPVSDCDRIVRRVCEAQAGKAQRRVGPAEASPLFPLGSPAAGLRLIEVATSRTVSPVSRATARGTTPELRLTLEALYGWLSGRVLGALESLRLHPTFRGGKKCLRNGFSESLRPMRALVEGEMLEA
jgi:hypothetical protein